tara:strand:+ start:1946 stop:3709 length:1764 start_codon:yes stop_codon:yes gene_type:complete
MSIIFNYFILLVFLLLPATITAASVDIKDIHYPLDVPFYLVDSLKDNDEKSALYMYLIESYTEQNLIDRSFQLIDSLPKSSLILTKPLYKSLFLTYYYHNSANDTIVLIDTLSNKLKPYILEACFIYSLEQLNIEDSITFFKSLESPIIKSRLANLLVDYFVTQNDVKNAYLYHDMIELPAEKEKSLATLAILFTQSGDIIKINKALTEITNETHRHSLLINVVTTLIDKNEQKTALNFLDQLKKSPVYEKALTYVIKNMITNNNFEDAISYAQTLNTDFYKHEVLISLGQGFAKAGNIIAINELLTSIESEDVLYQFIQDVSLILASNNFIEESFSLTKKLPNSLAFDHYQNLIKACDINSDMHFLLLSIKQINDYKIVNHTLATYAIQSALNNKHEQAIYIIKSITDLSTKDICVLTILENGQSLDLYTTYQPHLTEVVITSYIQYLTINLSGTISKQAVLDFTRQNVNPKLFSKENQLIYHIELGILFAINAEDNTNYFKKAIKQAKSANKLIRHLKQDVDLLTLSSYIHLESLLNRPKYALKILQKHKKYYHDTDILYLLGQIKDKDKKATTLLQSFAKDFQK